MAFSRVNLAINPALGGGAPWLHNGPGWVGSAALHASMPRPTGIVNSGGGTAVFTGPAAVVPGRTYVGSVSVRGVGVASAGACYLLWRDSAGVTVSTSGSTAYSVGSNATIRATTPAVVAPAGAAYCYVTLDSIDGPVQVTGVLVEQTVSTGGSYFDGDTAGASWAGTPGQSPSRIGTSELNGTIEYDDLLGRVRTFLAGAGVHAGRVQVLRRPTNGVVFTPVRGSSVAPVGGASPRSADDYEHPDVEDGFVYRLAAYSGAEELPLRWLGSLREEPPYDVLDLPFTPPTIRAWLKFVAAPQLNRKVTITGWEPIERPDRNKLYDVDGRTDPIVVTSGHSSRRTTLTLRTWTQDETDALDESLRQGIPGFLHLPGTVQLPSMYVVFGTYRHRPASKRSAGAIFTLPVVEVAAPPPSIFAVGATWQTVLDDYATWAALFAGPTEWRRVTS